LKLKKSIETIVSKIGLSTTEAIRLFLTPNQETIDAMRDANEGKALKESRSLRELRDRV
jgi:antitoxin component of RelBE/YafQ-DinJ toxin-antitoxin module